MPPKKNEKAVQLKGVDAENLIEQYLIKQYRPFGVNDIVQNLHNAVSKTNAIKALESLVAHDRIICKMFGKAPIYVCKEQQLSLPEDLDIKDITMENVEELREELNLLKNELNEWQTKLNQLNKDPTNVELIQTLLQKENEVLQIKDKLEKTNSDWNPENGIVIEQIIKQEKQIDKTIKERKKIMQDAVALVFMAQNLSNAKAKSEYLESIGFESITS